MAAISQKISSLIGGVSQQPDTVKFNGQLRSCDNYYPDVALGLMKRPGLQAIRKLDNPVADGTWFMVFRDNDEKYIMQFSQAGALKVWSANTGLQQTVNAVAAESTAYAVHDSQDDLQILQINDYIFVLNRNKTVSMAATTSAAITPYAFVAINTVAYKSTYTIKLNATEFTYTTPENVTSGTTNQLNVKDIVDNLVTTINLNASWVATGVGNNIHIRRADNADFAIEARGGNAGTSIEAFKGSVTAPGQLPKQFLDGLKIKVSGSNDTGADDYWVIFQTTDNTASGAGSWEETIAPSTVTTINEETMPHAIIREANGTFTYRKLDEASALASAGLTSVTGIPNSISVLSATTGGHVVDESFAVTGGSGSGLRLLVTKIKTNVTTSSTLATSSTYVISSTLFLFTTYTWFVNGVQIGQTSTPTLTVGNKVYSPNGTFATINNTLRAGITTTTTTTGVIDTVRIQQAGQGYTAGNTVTSTAGDTFTIVSVNTANLGGDDTRLKYWKPRVVGDIETNPTPTFVGYPIDAIAFYKNRLVFTSRQNVICSQAGDYFNFFADTVITLVDSDPIDLSASSLKPIRFKDALPGPNGLFIFGDNGQYLLTTTTEAFSPKTAEVNLLANYSLTDTIAPVDIGPSFVFLEEGQKASSIYEMDASSNGTGKPAVTELTRFIPYYIPTGISRIKCSTSAGVMAILSKSEPSSVYIYRWFQNGDQGRLSSWSRWMFPGTVEAFDFDQDMMYMVTKQGSNYVLSKMALLTDTPSQSLLFEEQYIDVRLDLFDYNPVLTYDAGTDLTHVCFKEGLENMDEQPVLMFMNPDVAGYFEEQTMQFDNSKPAGQKYFLTAEGNQTTSKFAIGYKYTATAQLPAFYFVRDVSNASKDTLNIPTVHRIKINSYNSGPYKAVVRSEGRQEFTLELPQINANYYLANNVPIIRNAQSVVPIMAKGNRFEFELVADNPFPTAFTSIDWEGTYNNKGIQSL
jgi:hypothetical protein